MLITFYIPCRCWLFMLPMLSLKLFRYKNELERSQPAGSCSSSSSSSTSSDLMLYTTPQKSFPTPASASVQRQQGIDTFSNDCIYACGILTSCKLQLIRAVFCSKILVSFTYYIIACMMSVLGLFLCARQQTWGASGEIQPGGGREKKAGDRTQNPASQSENILCFLLFCYRVQRLNKQYAPCFSSWISPQLASATRT